MHGDHTAWYEGPLQVLLEEATEMEFVYMGTPQKQKVTSPVVTLGEERSRPLLLRKELGP